mgnify:CR=1 FL=1
MTIPPTAKVLLATLLMLSVSGCGDIYRYIKSGQVGWALKRELRDRHVQKIELAKLTEFAWDELFLFGPYEPANEICKTLHLPEADGLPAQRKDRSQRNTHTLARRLLTNPPGTSNTANCRFLSVRSGERCIRRRPACLAPRIIRPYQSVEKAA